MLHPIVIVLLILPLVLLGCGPAKVKFNRNYLPNAIAEQPAHQIHFSESQNLIIERYLRSLEYGNDLALFWFHRNKAYLNLEGDVLFSIDMNSRQINAMGTEDTAGIRLRLSQKTKIINTVTKKGIASQIAGSIFPLIGQHYTGEVSVDDQRTLKVDIKTSETRNDTHMSAQTCASAKLIGDLTTDQEKIFSVQWDYPCAWLPRSVADLKISQILRKVRLSPSGNYLFYKNRLYKAGPNSTNEPLVQNYPHMICSTISPDWTAIAILRGDKGKHWIELFDMRLSDPPCSIHETAPPQH